VRLDRGTSIAGRVVDGDGKPVADVTVAAVPDLPDGSGDRDKVGPAEEFKGPDSAHAVATSGPDGAFLLERVGDLPYWLVVRSGGGDRTGAAVRASAGSADVKVVVETAASVAVTVVGPDDKPVAGARVTVF